MSQHNRAGGVRHGLIAIAVAAITSGVHAGVVTIVPGRDNSLFEDAAGSLSNGAGQYLFAGRTLQGLARRTLLRFDVSGQVPAGSTITSASLTLHVSRGVSSIVPMSVHRVSADWGEGASDAVDEEGTGIDAEPGDATWLNTFYPGSTWTNPGGDFLSTPSAIANIGGVGFWTWGSTSSLIADAQAMLDQPGSNFGWMILGDEFDTPPTAKRFDSRENPEASFRPVLRLEYIPTPGTGAMVMLAGIVAARRRR
ncbi:MAG: DNRLRE domain-containing protein [Phycisphaerales bacterium]|nr:DNRLRE domain-containing protein [Phycisphaerales bacterium]